MARTKMTPAEKKLDRQVSDVCQRLSVGYQIDIMKLGDIHDAGMLAARAGGDVEAAVLGAIKQYGKKVD